MNENPTPQPEGDFVPNGYCHMPSFKSGVEMSKWAAQEEWHGIYKQKSAQLDGIIENLNAELTAANARAEEYVSIARELAETSHVKEYSLIPRFIKAQAELEALNKINA